jgi:glyoxylase-like metal-dependent hydrolase (beta-lactamase superfamily II)
VTLTSGPAEEAGAFEASVPGLDCTRHLSTSGIFSLDGEDFEVENNVWIVGGVVRPGTRPEVIIVDAPHSVAAIAAAVQGMRVVAIVATHGHNDHINAAVELRETVGAPILLHRADLALWREVYADDRGVVYSGDTLFRGGPGATGRSWSDFPTIIESIRDRLLVLPPDTRVLTGHGDSTMIGVEAPHLEEWIARGH